MNPFVQYKHCWIDSLPPHLSVKLADNEIKSLLQQGGWMVRNTYDYDSPEPTDFWYVVKDHFGGLDELSSNTRNQIRRSLKTIVFRQITAQQLIDDDGYMVMLQAHKGYKDSTAMPTMEEYEKIIVERPDGTEYWGGYLNEDSQRLVVYAICKITEGVCDYQVIKIDPDYQKHYYPVYGLLYTMNEHYLQQRQMRYVLDGARSMTEHSNIQPFLEQKFKFRKAYCKVQIAYSWWLKLLISITYPLRHMMPHQLKGLMRTESIRRSQTKQQKH